MSNYFTVIFLLFVIPVSTIGKSPDIPALDSLLSEADTYFNYDRFAPALDIYEDLFEQGYFQEEMLYRMAFMYEQAGNFPESIYYLRKIQWEMGGENLDAKIQQLMSKASQERLSAGDSWTVYRLFVQHTYTSLSILMAIFVLLSMSLIFIPRVWTLRVGAGFALLALVVGFVLLEQRWNLEPKAVVMNPSQYYEVPSFGAKNYSLPIGPGATVQIVKIEDIWAQVRMAQFEAWVPRFVIREL